MLFLEAVAHGEHWYDAVERVRASVDGLGFVLEERPFSALLVSFQIELSPHAAARWAEALERRRVELLAPSKLALAGADAGEPLTVMLAVRIPEGDPNKTNLVPSVPG